MNPIDDVLNRLQNVKQHNSYFMASCPAHPDDEPSLSISEGDDGKVLLKCFAGCTAEEIVVAIDLKMSDLFAERGGGGVIPLNTDCITASPIRKHA